MEESLDLFSLLKRDFAMEETDIRTFSPLTLAFIGDGIYDLIIRTVLVERGNRSVEVLHKQKSALVKAKTQADMAEAIFEDMTEEEQTVYRRGRNATSHTMAKNASMSEYRKATGFEALCGYLYLSRREERMVELIQSALDRLNLSL